MGSLLGWLGWFVACLVGYVLSWLAAHWVPAVLDLVKGLFACFLHACTRPDVGMLRWLAAWLHVCSFCGLAMCLLVACVFDHAQVQLHGLPACIALLHLYNTSFMSRSPLERLTCFKLLSGKWRRWLLRAVGWFLG